MNYVLLLGAGFSRNWGGWLADEAFEYLLGCPQITMPLRQLLIKHKRKGGFEAALAELQEGHNPAARRSPGLLDKFQEAIAQMFSDMDTAFDSIQFEPSNSTQNFVAAFLAKFDAIFTLNQDLLLERHYLNDNVSHMSNSKWSGWSIPGMVKQGGDHVHRLMNPNLGMWVPDSSADFQVLAGFQPYFKLHGSSNWYASATDNVMVIGAEKRSTIDRYEILKFNFERFHEYLCTGDVRLMIIGYGFGDDHINQLIVNAVDTSELRIFVVDPLGIDVMDENRGATIYTPSVMAQTLWPRVIGASRRPLNSTFNDDIVEHYKVMRFFG